MAAPPAQQQNAWSSYRPGTAQLPSTSAKQPSPPNIQRRERERPKWTGSGADERSFDRDGNRLDIINWKGEEIVPVRKVFMVKHPDIEFRTPEESDVIRLKYGIDAKGPPGMEIPTPVESLEQTPFPDWAAKVLRSRNWQKPTPIQVQGWPAAMSGHDVIGIASTGSGKTMAYILPMLIHIIAQAELKPGEGPVGLVLVPTRELCGQVAREVQIFGRETNLVCQSIFGGEDQEKQRKAVLERVDIIVATPGRLIKMLNDRCTNLRRATYVVIDEADDMLDKSFGEQVRLIMTQIRPDRQVLLFSATFQENVERFARDMCEQWPIQISVGGTKLSACKDIRQSFWSPGKVSHYWPVGAHKLEALSCAVMRLQFKSTLSRAEKALIFVNKVHTVPAVVKKLQSIGLVCEGFTGDFDQAARQEILQRFKSGDELHVLVATQVLGRGHDFQNVKWVINYDMPWSLVDYVHRIGRTGRAGKRGDSLTLLEEPDLRFARQLVEILRETENPIPHWLAFAKRHTGKRTKEFQASIRKAREEAYQKREEAFQARRAEAEANRAGEEAHRLAAAPSTRTIMAF